MAGLPVQIRVAKSHRKGDWNVPVNFERSLGLGS
jgi:hypothetical protein